MTQQAHSHSLNLCLTTSWSPTDPRTHQQHRNRLNALLFTDSQPFASPRTDASFPSSAASVSPPEKDARLSSITRRPYDTSLPTAPKEEPPSTIVLGDEGITSTTTVAGHPLPTRQLVSPRCLPRFLRSMGPQPMPSLTSLLELISQDLRYSYFWVYPQLTLSILPL